MRKLERYVLMILFGAVILSPLFWKITGWNISLSGVSESVDGSEATTQNIWSGEFFSDADSYLKSNLPGRNLMIKVRNQILFSVFDKSPNDNILKGKDGELFESNYLNEYMQIPGAASDEYLEEMSEKILQLRSLLEKKNIKLLLFLTPNKVRYYAEDIPYAWKISGDRKEICNHDRLVKVLKDKEINYFDSIPLVEKYEEEGDAVFYKTGTHWSNKVAAKVAREFSDYFEIMTGYDIPEFQVESTALTEPLYPDADIFDTLNLFTKAYDKYESADCIVTDSNTDAPNVFFRGGSFMGQSLKRLVDVGAFGKNVHFENNYIHYENYSKIEWLSKFDAYDEIDLEQFMKDTNVVILEINEAAISNMTWGFIDYLLEHPEIIENS